MDESEQEGGKMRATEEECAGLQDLQDFGYYMATRSPAEEPEHLLQ